MNVLKPIATSQSITVYTRPHTGTTYVLKVTDEETNVTSTKTSTHTADGLGKMTFTFAYPFKEGRFYMINITATKLIYRGKIYATAQTGQYSVSSYTKPTENKNTFIVKQ